MLERRDIELLRESLRRFQLRQDAMAIRFYENLVGCAPEALPFFSKDLADDPERGVQAMFAVVALLESSDESTRMVSVLRHRSIAASAARDDYEKIAMVLKRTLSQVFGSSLDEDYYAVWDRALAVVGDIIFNE